MRMIAFLAAIVAAGCATDPVYVNPSIADAETLARQRIIDEGYCTRASSGSVPLPQARVYQADRGVYQVAPSPGDAFASGVVNGMNMAAAIQARKDREKIFAGCMYTLGWEEAEK